MPNPDARNWNSDQLSYMLTADVLERGTQPKKPVPTDIADKLERRFGLGDKPKSRRQLYLRIERNCLLHGPRAYHAVRQAAISADGKVYPDRYFVVTVLRLLAQMDCLDD